MGMEGECTTSNLILDVEARGLGEINAETEGGGKAWVPHRAWVREWVMEGNM